MPVLLATKIVCFLFVFVFFYDQFLRVWNWGSFKYSITIIPELSRNNQKSAPHQISCKFEHLPLIVMYTIVIWILRATTELQLMFFH